MESAKSTASDETCYYSKSTDPKNYIRVLAFSSTAATNPSQDEDSVEEYGDNIYQLCVNGTCYYATAIPSSLSYSFGDYQGIYTRSNKMEITTYWDYEVCY